MNAKEIKFWYWVVGLLPKKLVYFCALHVLAYASTHEYSNLEMGLICGMDAITTYRDDKGVQ